MRNFVRALCAASMLSAALAGPAMAQSYADQQRWDTAQQRYQAETQRYNTERDRFYSLRDRRGAGYNRNSGYNDAPGYGAANNGYVNGSGWGETQYDATRYYRDDPRYQERQLSANDQVYQGSDGRYYCKRSDGTTGLILGAAAGGVLGNVVDGGRKRTAGTLLGGALGALLGKSAEQNSANVRCR